MVKWSLTLQMKRVRGVRCGGGHAFTGRGHGTGRGQARLCLQEKFAPPLARAPPGERALRARGNEGGGGGGCSGPRAPAPPARAGWRGVAPPAAAAPAPRRPPGLWPGRRSARARGPSASRRRGAGGWPWTRPGLLSPATWRPPRRRSREGATTALPRRPSRPPSPASCTPARGGPPSDGAPRAPLSRSAQLSRPPRAPGTSP